MALAQLSQAQVSIGRVASFLGMKEVSEDGYIREEDNCGKGEVLIENATIYWKDPNTPITKADIADKSLNKSEHTKQSEEGELVYPKPVVSDISLSVAAGELYAVVGRVGSGKSSLCAAILNETVLSEGSKITVKGRVAYVAQSSWILNKTVRDNILFGMPFDEEKYNKVIAVCQLTHDLNMLEDGDLTEIGERGINLSGGQKQRISVARAAYADADLIIMDDPLSALDPEVARDLFEDCIVGFMKGKARILVTNQLQCLPKCDSVIALGNGRVIEQGTYCDLMKAEGEVQRLLKELEENAKSEESTPDEEEKKDDGVTAAGSSQKTDDAKAIKLVTLPTKDSGDAKALTTKEEREAGAVKSQVYLKYLKAGGGYLRFAVVYLAFILCSGISLLTTIWIALWSADTSYVRHTQGFYLGLYSGTAVLLGVVTFFRSYLLATFGVRASKTLHKNLLRSILRAPMSFYDTTPMGRILSRFSKDMHTIDQELSDFLDFVLFMTLSVVVTMGTITFATPLFGVVLLPLLWFYLKVLNYFRQVSRETKRLESLSRSPVYAQFSETLGGLSTIRAYGEASSFISEFDTKLDASTQAVYCNKTADRWLAVRLELLGAVIAGLAAIFSTQIVISNGQSGIGDNSQFASLAGLSLTYAIQVTGLLNWVVRSFAQVEAAMNSCERVFHYTENIPQEAAATSAQLENDHVKKCDDNSSSNPWTLALVSAGGKAVHPSPEWPNNGTIKLTNLTMRYRQETPLVLKGLDVTIRGGERIGVVGRTGSGKSSLFLCLMRIVEPELAVSGEYQPPLMVDDVDVLRIGLVDLRSKFGIIPQNPVLFSGSIRSNMDPFDEYTDEQIMSALEKCGMKSTVLEMTDGLLAPVAEYGSNLSQGQRQLLCMGRALLKNCRILLLDEATSSVDFETDREIQRTLRQAFQGSTVLTIAHRVDTIMDSDKILVMKDGVAAEFASPEELLEDETSLFSEIVRQGEID
jgi:ATP-binding cassette, subfamily C (CFTR/MRP), member 1